MLGMTQDQLMGLLRQVLPIVGGILVAIGWIKPASVTTWTDTIIQIAGPLFTLWGLIWSLIANNKTSIITAAANIPEVKKIEVTDPEIAQATPATVVLKPVSGL